MGMLLVRQFGDLEREPLMQIRETTPRFPGESRQAWRLRQRLEGKQ